MVVAPGRRITPSPCASTRPAPKLRDQRTATGDLWTDAKLRHLVKNPVYMGKPTNNKGGQPRFFEIKSGKISLLGDTQTLLGKP